MSGMNLDGQSDEGIAKRASGLTVPNDNGWPSIDWNHVDNIVNHVLYQQYYVDYGYRGWAYAII